MTHRDNNIDKNLVMEAKFNDILTSSSYNTLVAELIKYILYHKQQLPYTFDNLKYLVTKKKSLKKLDKSKSAILTRAEQLFKVAEDGFKTLEMIFERTKEEMSVKGRVLEIVLLFGGSPMTPKQVYHIHLPEFHCDHSLQNHSDRKYLLQLLRHIIESSQLNEMLVQPMNPTNMFVFIRKNANVNGSSTNNLSPWFLPRNRFRLPPTGQHFHIVLSQASQDEICACQNHLIHNETPNSPSSDQLPLCKDMEIKGNSDMENCERQTEWFQACSTFKGFKDVYVNGISVSNLWTK